MRKEYDFSKGIKNPYAKLLKKQITIRLEFSTIAYFQQLGQQVGLPYQSLINLYLKDCVQKKRKLKFA
ncbi:MAG: BrnA antitoxin family protein [Elusimicrobia bacterium]|nr:BrnA antitoxin family protein [Elusimicrobiota bacterium]